MNLTERWATPEIPLSNTTLRIHLKKIHVAHACVLPSLKHWGWKMSFLLGRPILRCYVSFREGKPFFWGVFFFYMRK